MLLLKQFSPAVFVAALVTAFVAGCAQKEGAEGGTGSAATEAAAGSAPTGIAAGGIDIGTVAASVTIPLAIATAVRALSGGTTTASK